MKKKNGFTLVELIAVIAILVVILAMFVPTLLNSINENKTKALNKIYDLIETAARNYVMDYNISTPTKIELEDLCNTTYIECPIINPETEEELNGYIFVGEDYYYSEVTETNVTVELNGGDTSQTFENSYEPGFTIELNDVLKESYTFLGWEVVEGNSAIKDNKLTIGTTKTTIKPKLVRYLNNYIKYMYDDETTREQNGLTNPMFTSNGKEFDTGIRYAGSNPNNYVYFNCDDKDSNNIKYGDEDYNYVSSCEKWRMIGVFELENATGNIDKRVKLVRDALTDANGNVIKMSYDSSLSDVNNGYGINQWGPSTYEDGSTYEGADIMRLLNGYYIGKESTCTYCNASSQELCSNDCTNNIKQMSINSLSLIEDVLWKLGSSVRINQIEKIYEFERSERSGKICQSNVTYNDEYWCTDKVNRKNEWVGKIGLVYLSDYGYASTDDNCGANILSTDGICNNNNWLYTNNLYYKFLTPYSNETFASQVFGIKKNGVLDHSTACTIYAIRPSLYLKSSVHTTGGDGTENNPYKLAT